MSLLLLPVLHSSAAAGPFFSLAALPCFSHRHVAAHLGRCTLRWVVL